MGSLNFNKSQKSCCLSFEVKWHLSGVSPRLRAAEQMEGGPGTGGRHWRRRRFICKALSDLTNGDTHYFYVADDRRIPFMLRNDLALFRIVQLLYGGTLIRDTQTCLYSYSPRMCLKNFRLHIRTYTLTYTRIIT